METTYNYVSDESANLDKPFVDQPNNLLFPTKITKTFIQGEATKSYSLEMETDEYGNQLSQTAPSGVTETSAYYAIEGEEGNCPPDPFGHFQRFIKEHKVISQDKTLVKQKLFFYKKALEAADNSESTSKRIGKSFISTTTGADFDAFSDAANSTNSIVKRSMNGAWAATQIAGAGVGWTLLIEGTWSVDNDTDSEDMASGGLKSYVVQMVNDKYPIA